MEYTRPKEELRDEAVEKLDELTKNQISLNLFSSYANDKNRETFNFLNGYFDHKTIEDSIEQGIYKEAERDYKLVTRKNSTIWPDHVPDQEIFATGLLYGLMDGKFSKKDINKINFDHGDNFKSFTKRYANFELSSNLRKKLANPPKLPSLNVFDISCDAEHPVTEY